jgi:hypothetical protein
MTHKHYVIFYFREQTNGNKFRASKLFGAQPHPKYAPQKYRGKSNAIYRCLPENESTLRTKDEGLASRQSDRRS